MSSSNNTPSVSVNAHGEGFVSTMARVNPYPTSDYLKHTEIVRQLGEDERKEYLNRAYLQLEGEVSKDPHYGRVDEASPPKELGRYGLPECPISCFGGVLLGDMSPSEAYRVTNTGKSNPNSRIYTSEEAILRWALPTLLMGERTTQLGEVYASGISPFGGKDPQDGGVSTPENQCPPPEGISTIETSTRKWGCRAYSMGEDISPIAATYLADEEDMGGRIVHRQRAKRMPLLPTLWGIVVPCGESMAVGRLRKGGIGRKPQAVAPQGVTPPAERSKEAIRMDMLALFAKGLITQEEMLKYC